MAICNFLYRRLEQQRAVSGSRQVAGSNCGLVYARSCFRMNASERNIEPTEEFEEAGHERTMQAASQDGIPKHAGCQRDQVPVRLVCCRARRFGEVEPLVFQ